MHFQGLYVIQCLGYEDKILHATVQKKLWSQHLFHLCLHTTVQTHTVTGTLVNMHIVC